MSVRPHILFVTGKLAEPSLRRTLADLGPRAGFDFSVAVLPITVVALATTDWIARHLHTEGHFDRVLLPGLCQGEIALVAQAAGNAKVERGPSDLRDLPGFFGSANLSRDGYGSHDITILAEINHAPRLSLPDLLCQAKEAQADGADVIDLGCDPGGTWSEVGAAVAMLRQEGLRVSLDSFDVARSGGSCPGWGRADPERQSHQSGRGQGLGLRGRGRARHPGRSAGAR